MKRKTPNRPTTPATFDGLEVTVVTGVGPNGVPYTKRLDRAEWESQKIEKDAHIGRTRRGLLVPRFRRIADLVAKKR